MLLDLSQSGIEPRSPECEAKALPLRNRCVTVRYFCHHLSDNYVDLSDHYVDFSEKKQIIKLVIVQSICADF